MHLGAFGKNLKAFKRSILEHLKAGREHLRAFKQLGAFGMH